MAEEVVTTEAETSDDEAVSPWAGRPAVSPWAGRTRNNPSGHPSPMGVYDLPPRSPVAIDRYFDSRGRGRTSPQY